MLKLIFGLTGLASVALSLIRFKPFKRKIALWMPIIAVFLWIRCGLFGSSSPTCLLHLQARAAVSGCYSFFLCQLYPE